MAQNILQVSNINKSFGKKSVLRDVSLSVSQGESLGFIGPNGAGKTTLIRIILGLVRSDQGSVIINGHPLRGEFKKAIGNVGSVVETPRFYSYLSAYHNLQMTCNLHPQVKKEKIAEVLELVGLTARAGDKVGTYSLGMKQRLGLARALVSNPTLIFLDEPMNGMDPQGMIETRALILKLKERGISFFITSHLLSEVEQVCDHIAIIKTGQIITRGSMEQLLTRNFETVDIYTSETATVTSVLQNVSFVHQIKTGENRVTAEIDRKSSANLNRLLVERKIPVDYLVPNNTTLEQLFIELTGGGEDSDGSDKK
ncbi:MAG: ABC transporter ATP-binding protein [Clostridiales bacterium]|jgi:ABC-2 type transport system ATP-binding protein|nr:ABC transporter ATP-binding protein [Clostridiales bacterium]